MRRTLAATLEHHGIRTVSGGRLLIVDDDAAFGQRLARAMERRGFVTDVAESAEAANAMAERNRAMAERLDLWLAQGHSLFIVVGAAHVVGPVGLVALLRERGYRLERR
jgi:two-component system response regulator RegA